MEKRQPRAVARTRVGLERRQQTDKARVVFRGVAGQMRPLMREYGRTFRRGEIGIEQRFEQKGRVHAVHARRAKERRQQRRLRPARRRRNGLAELTFDVVERLRQLPGLIAGRKARRMSGLVRFVHRSRGTFGQRGQRCRCDPALVVADDRLERDARVVQPPRDLEPEIEDGGKHRRVSHARKNWPQRPSAARAAQPAEPQPDHEESRDDREDIEQRDRRLVGPRRQAGLEGRIKPVGVVTLDDAGGQRDERRGRGQCDGQ